jgi:hypothetical protein
MESVDVGEPNIDVVIDRFFEGEKCNVVSEIRTVEIQGKLHRAKVIIVDFRGNSSEKEFPGNDQLVVHIHGLGNSSQLFNKAADSGDFSTVRNTLEYQAIMEAKTKKGLYFQSQLLEFASVDDTPSFKEDALVHLEFLKQSKVDLEKADVTLNGYSEGAAIAKHLAKLVQDAQGSDEGGFTDKLRLFSLTGVVPVKEILRSFSKTIWNDVIMSEAARRVDSVLPERHALDEKISTYDDQVKMIRLILTEITVGKKRQEALSQLKDAIKGNIDLLMDVGRRFSLDIWNGSRQLSKFLDDEEVGLDSRWTVDLRVPKKDNVYPLSAWLQSLGIEVDDTFDLMDKVAFFRDIVISKLFPKVSSLNVHVFGDAWYRPENSHTGPTDNPRLFYFGEGGASLNYARMIPVKAIPQDVILALASMA